MFIQKTNDFDKCFSLYSKENGGEGLFTYGILRENLSVDRLKEFEAEFKQYLCGEKGDNNMVGFLVPDEDVAKVNEMFSKYEHN